MRWLRQLSPGLNFAAHNSSPLFLRKHPPVPPSWQRGSFFSSFLINSFSTLEEVTPVKFCPLTKVVLVSSRSRIRPVINCDQCRSFRMSPAVENQKETVVASPGKKLKLMEDKENSVGSDRSKLYFVKLSETAQIPTKGSKFAAGYDLKSAYKATVPARGSALVKTDIQIQLPHGTYGRVAPRSGLALKNKIDVGAGVIDEDYRGNVGVILFNHGDTDFEVDVGDRIAQLICEKIEYPEVVEVEKLEDSDRGAGGFGSTGTKN